MRSTLLIIALALAGLLVVLTLERAGGEPSLSIAPDRGSSRTVQDGMTLDLPAGDQAGRTSLIPSDQEPPPPAAPPKVSFGRLLGQVLQADGTPVSGGEIRFASRGSGSWSTYLVHSSGLYSTGPIPAGEQPAPTHRVPEQLTNIKALISANNSKPLPSGTYTALYRSGRESAWQEIPNLYSSTDPIDVLPNSVLTQDFVLRDGVRVVGLMRIELPDVPSAVGSIEIVSLADGVALGRRQVKLVSPGALRAPRFPGDSKEPRQGDFCFENIPPGDYVLRLFGVGSGIPPDVVPLHAARELHVGFEDVFLDDMLIPVDEFIEHDPTPLRLAPLRESKKETR